MLREFGCTYVIVGHSERRALFGEDSDTVARKFKAALEAGLMPILCVGETLAEREAGETERVVDAQLAAVTKRLGAQALAQRCGRVRAGLGDRHRQDGDAGAGAGGACAHPRAHRPATRCSVARDLRILYGGSVKAANAAELFAMPDIDGGLIGGASLMAAEFVAICRAAERMTE